METSINALCFLLKGRGGALVFSRLAGPNGESAAPPRGHARGRSAAPGALGGSYPGAQPPTAALAGSGGALPGSQPKAARADAPAIGAGHPSRARQPPTRRLLNRLYRGLDA